MAVPHRVILNRAMHAFGRLDCRLRKFALQVLRVLSRAEHEEMQGRLIP